LTTRALIGLAAGLAAGIAISLRPSPARHGISYVDRILRGARPKDLPVYQASRFQLAINLNAAKAIGLVIPTSILGARRRGDRMTGERGRLWVNLDRIELSASCPVYPPIATVELTSRFGSFVPIGDAA
jgi:ABC transporter substrate binding protein